MTTSAVEQSGLVARLRHIFTALPVAAILLLAIVFGTSSYMHSQMLSLGQSMWSNYGMVRADMRAPTCDPNFDVEARVEKQMQTTEGQAEDSLLAFQAPIRITYGAPSRANWPVAKSNISCMNTTNKCVSPLGCALIPVLNTVWASSMRWGWMRVSISSLPLFYYAL